jgi:putative endonuclease
MDAHHDSANAHDAPDVRDDSTDARDERAPTHPPARHRTAAQQAGDAAEDAVAKQLAAVGWTILARNVHVSRAELDIVAVDPGPPADLVIVEVRMRSRRDFGLPEETVDHRKRTRIRHAAYGLLECGGYPHLPLRFDLIVVEPGSGGGEPRIRHHRAAF